MMYFGQIEQEKKRPASKLKIGILAAVFLILVAGAVYLVVYSPVFRIKNIEITGNKEVDKDEIINVFKDIIGRQSKLLTSVLKTNNILLWGDNENLYQEVKSSIPKISEVSLKKDYFNRSIKISIKEREKFGVWCAGEAAATSSEQSAVKDCFWFDNNGVIFAEAPTVEGNLINKVDDYAGRSLKPGDVVLSEKFFVNLAKIFGVLEKSDMKIKSLKLYDLGLQEVFTNPEIVSLPSVYFSLRFDPKFALPAIESMKKIGLSKIGYIDLRVENRVYYKTK
jgi:hypothetical protein